MDPHLIRRALLDLRRCSDFDTIGSARCTTVLRQLLQTHHNRFRLTKSKEMQPKCFIFAYYRVIDILFTLEGTRQIWGIWKLRPAHSPETPNLGQNRWCFVPCDLEIWWMTLENNRASLLCRFKLCATFHSHWWIQTGVTVRKCPIWVKFDDFQSRVTLKFHVWPWKTIGHLFYATSSFVHHFVAIGEFKLELQSGNAQSGSKLTIFLAVWPCNLTYDLEKQ